MESTSESPETTEPVIELRDIGVWYRLRSKKHNSLKSALLQGRYSGETRTLWALRHLDFSCHEGEVVGIVGSNGAGKSTLCLLLAGILEPDEGVANVRGKATPLLSLGTGMHGELTGREGIYFYSAFLGISRETVDEKLEEIVAFSELEAFLDEPVHTYSSGMRARLAFSVATALDPEILILDEVLGVGDQQFRKKSQKRIREMMERSRLIVIVSHSLPFLKSACTHCLWIDKGSPVAFGESSEILARYEEGSTGA